METKTKLHGLIKVNGTTVNYDLQHLKLNVECILRVGGYSGMNHEDKGHSFGYQLTQANHPNFVNLKTFNEDTFDNQVFHKTEIRNLKIAIDNFLLSEINCRGLNK